SSLHIGTAPLDIGAAHSGTASYFPGKIGYVMIYNRALSSSEIAQLYREPFAMISDTGASTITGAAWNSSGKYNSALDFDGYDDVITVAIDSDIDLNSKTGYSVCGWINPDSDGEGSQGEWFSKGDSYIRVDTESGSTVEVSALFDLATTDATLNTSKTIPTGSWSHICTTWKDDSDDELTIYINGINAGSSTNGSGAPVDDSASHLYIGGDSSNNFDGDIDEVTIYNYELTSQQVKLDYNQGSALRFGD
ncbi:LamG domain-containing protein, partial [Patescibacteria group bacterium]|nr:LamG domain-containing protein [Patescibacteria group bacterium]